MGQMKGLATEHLERLLSLTTLTPDPPFGSSLFPGSEMTGTVVHIHPFPRFLVKTCAGRACFRDSRSRMYVRLGESIRMYAEVEERER